MADRAALAIEHARLFEAERAARVRIEHVQAVTDAALAHLEVNELLDVLLPRIRDILRTDTCAVLLLDEETNELVARAALGIEEEVGVRIPLGAGFAGRVADEARPMVIDVDEYPVYNPILRQKHLKSMVGVPLLVRGVSLGVLHVGTLDAAGVHAGRGRAAPARCRAGRDRHRAGAAARGAHPARPAQAELRRHRLARAADAGHLRLRRPQDARRPRARS